MGDVRVILPLVCLVGGAFFVYVVARLISRKNALLASITTLILLVSLILVCVLDIQIRSRGNGQALEASWGSFDAGAVFLQVDPVALIVIEVGLGLGILVTIYSGRYLALDKRYENYYPLLLLLLTGITGMVLAVDLLNDPDITSTETRVPVNQRAARGI